MTDDQIKSLNDSIKALNDNISAMHKPSKFNWQGAIGLLTPLVIAIFGLIINKSIQEKEDSIKNIEFLQTSVKPLFRDGSPETIAATLMLAKEMMPNKQMLIDSLKKLINSSRNYTVLQLTNTPTAKNADSLNKLILADTKANVITGQQFYTPIHNNKVNSILTKYRRALKYDSMGYTNLLTGNITKAQRNFTAADSTYNGIHSAYELGSYLRNNYYSDSNLSDEKKKELYKTVLAKYSYGMPSELKEKMQNKN